MKLYLKAAIFTVLAPGSVGGLVPALITRGQDTAGGALLVLALSLMTAGGAIYLRCAWDFVRYGRGTPSPIDAPKRLVIRGLYRYSRNPMYVGLLTLVAGWAILFASATMVAYGVALFIIASLFVRFYEERHLSREFGDEYEMYKVRVGRWLPRLSRRDES
jgi:protein-S-isoprenylcysteine O-methyltransferase Ste14